MEESIEAVMAKYRLHREAPSVSDAELNETKYILIRHGYSQYNFITQVCREEHGEQSPELQKLISGSD